MKNTQKNKVVVVSDILGWEVWMERSFSCFGHSQRFRVDSALGLDDQQTQIDEINDIEAFLPDMTLEMITPKPEGK